MLGRICFVSILRQAAFDYAVSLIYSSRLRGGSVERSPNAGPSIIRGT